jgi:hypothetical protein
VDSPERDEIPDPSDSPVVVPDEADPAIGATLGARPEVTAVPVAPAAYVMAPNDAPARRMTRGMTPAASAVGVGPAESVEASTAAAGWGGPTETSTAG